jgi:hypothetical protein
MRPLISSASAAPSATKYRHRSTTTCGSPSVGLWQVMKAASWTTHNGPPHFNRCARCNPMSSDGGWLATTVHLRVAAGIILAASGTSAAGAQQCNLSGKRIYYRDQYCATTMCFHTQMILTVLGDKILSADASQKTGLIFYLGKTVDATEDPAQKGFAETLQPPTPNSRKRVMTTANYVGNSLNLKQEELFYTNRSTPDLTITFTEQIYVPAPSCNTCKQSGTFDARWANGKTDVVNHVAYLCEITDVQ